MTLNSLVWFLANFLQAKCKSLPETICVISFYADMDVSHCSVIILYH